jgi:hypothetical protein
MQHGEENPRRNCNEDERGGVRQRVGDWAFSRVHGVVLTQSKVKRRADAGKAGKPNGNTGNNVRPIEMTLSPRVITTEDLPGDANNEQPGYGCGYQPVCDVFE